MKVRRAYCWLAGVAFSLVGPGVSVTSAYSTAEDTVKEYRLWYRNYDSPQIRALVALAFDKTPEYGPYQITRTPEMAQGRVIRELEQQRSTLVDLANVATTGERERDLRAIPIPIDGGLLGLRVCVVLKESLPKFEGIRSLDDLQEAGIRIGQGAHWPDSSILQVNGVTVVTHSRYEILFRMLENHRFECFARGVSEVLFDLALENDADFVIEPNLLLAYPMPSYFFVSRNDHETAQRLQLGMERAIYDGSFGDYLNRYYGRAIDELGLDNRTVLVLDNPFLTGESWAIGRQTLRELRRRIKLLSTPDTDPVKP
ncbi:hypothetical protein NLU14_08135 [Marinobacter sp. 71-i]|uniref:Solute-binding protein family 3/N-terminal domain-containing protein n=1 Tax=Marinobacter iranensis TaxID=2962607 RepID=A0ABT5Y936_9GAMM|nr:hypothetical protein [Marinobacter iranensis]MDF0750198.1 hypothetical protein [Marinobacter iranensis]